MHKVLPCFACLLKSIERGRPGDSSNGACNQGCGTCLSSANVASSNSTGLDSTGASVAPKKASSLEGNHTIPSQEQFDNAGATTDGALAGLHRGAFRKATDRNWELVATTDASGTDSSCTVKQLRMAGSAFAQVLQQTGVCEASVDQLMERAVQSECARVQISFQAGGQAAFKWTATAELGGGTGCLRVTLNVDVSKVDYLRCLYEDMATVPKMATDPSRSAPESSSGSPPSHSSLSGPLRAGGQETASINDIDLSYVETRAHSNVSHEPPETVNASSHSPTTAANSPASNVVGRRHDVFADLEALAQEADREDSRKLLWPVAFRIESLTPTANSSRVIFGTYDTVWEQLDPLMQAKYGNLRTRLRDRLRPGFSQTEIFPGYQATIKRYRCVEYLKMRREAGWKPEHVVHEIRNLGRISANVNKWICYRYGAKGSEEEDVHLNRFAVGVERIYKETAIPQGTIEQSLAAADMVSDFQGGDEQQTVWRVHRLV